MLESDWFLIVPSTGGSLLVWVLLVLVVCYLARWPVHGLVRAISLSLRHAGRMLARHVEAAARRARVWSRQLLLVQQRDSVRQELVLDFDRLAFQVDRDLADLPVLRERLTRQLSAMEEDFRRSAEVPPEPPAWAQVTRVIADESERRTGEIARALEDIRDALAQYRADAREEIRESSHRRYLLLYRMTPRWRRVEAVLERVNARFARIEQRIDQLRRREYLLRSGRRRERIGTLALATLGRFALASAILVAAWYGVVLLFGLLQPVLTAVVGNQPLLNGLGAASVMGGLVIFIQLGLVLLLCEALRLSRVLPGVAPAELSRRRLLFWAAFLPLLALAAAMAFLHLRLGLAEIMQPGLLLAPEALELRVTGEMIQGLALFTLPFLLGLGAIALGVLLRSVRPTIGMLITGALQVVAFLLRGVVVASAVAARLLIQLYDLLIFLPLWLEALWRARRSAAALTAVADGEGTPARLNGPRAAVPVRERAY